MARGHSNVLNTAYADASRVKTEPRLMWRVRVMQLTAAGFVLFIGYQFLKMAPWWPFT